MNIKLTLVATIIGLGLAGCQTTEQAAEANAYAVCSANGYGESSAHYAYCMNSLKPIAIQMEKQRRLAQAQQSIGQIADGIQGSPVAPQTLAGSAVVQQPAASAHIPIWCMNTPAGDGIVCR